MRLSHNCRQLGLKLVLNFAAIVICAEATVAGSLTVKVRQIQSASTTLKDIKPTNRTVQCPSHFRPVQLSADIDLEDFASVSAEPEFSIHIRASAEKRRVESLAAGQIQLNLLGCQFGKHFLPQHGHVTLIINLEDRRTSTRMYLYDPDDGHNSLGVNYRSLLAGRPEVYWSRFKEDVFGTENKAIGSILLDFPYEKLSIAGTQPNNEVRLKGFFLELILLSKADTQ